MSRLPYSFFIKKDFSIKKWKLTISIIGLLCYSGISQLPETDIWLFKIEKPEKPLGKYTITNSLNINNRPGYDNQPAFTPDNKSLLYVSIKEDKQADIYRYDIKSKLHTNVTKSKVSEYSPTILPGESGLSSVVVEEDSAQRVWIIGFDGSFIKFANDVTDSVGYHSWMNADTLLYYKLTEPNSLRALNLKTGNDVWLCDNPSRAFRKIPGTSNFIYAIKNDALLEFRIYNSALRESKVYTTYASGNEDFIWHADLGLIKAENSDLLNYNEKTNKWDVLFSFANLGIKKITRFVFDSKTKQLAIVSNL